MVPEGHRKFRRRKSESGEAILQLGESEFTIPPFLGGRGSELQIPDGPQDIQPRERIQTEYAYGRLGPKSSWPHRDYCYLREPGTEGWRYLIR